MKSCVRLKTLSHEEVNEVLLEKLTVLYATISFNQSICHVRVNTACWFYLEGKHSV